MSSSDEESDLKSDYDEQEIAPRDQHMKYDQDQDQDDDLEEPSSYSSEGAAKTQQQQFMVPKQQHEEVDELPSDSEYKKHAENRKQSLW